MSAMQASRIMNLRACIASLSLALERMAGDVSLRTADHVKLLHETCEVALSEDEKEGEG